MIEYIYALVCPIAGKPRYIGKTKNIKRRYNQHLKKLDKTKTKKRLWLEDLFDKNMKPKCIVLEEVTSEKARDREQYYVEKYKDSIFNIHNPGKGIKDIEKNDLK